MVDIFVYTCPLPEGVNEMVVPCLDGYTVYINEQLTRAGALQAYNHAVGHIKRGDFEQDKPVDMIEIYAHGIS